MRAKRILLVAIVTLFSGPLIPLWPASPVRADDTSPSSLESGTEIRPIHRVTPRYPVPEAEYGVEGWVIVSYVVKPDGTVGDTIIEDSSGRKAFERATIDSVKEWRYEPATMNGEPVERCHNKALFTFALEQGKKDHRGAKKAFKNQYKRAIKLLEEGELEEVRSKIDEIAAKFTTNLYESSRLWILRAMLHEKEGDDLGQLESLQHAVAGGGAYVEPEVYLNVMLKIFNLQIQFQHYADALETLEAVDELDLDESTAAKLRQATAEIEELKTSDRAVAIGGKIGEAQEEHHGAGVWSHTLLRRTAGIEKISGSLERVELRCDWHRVKAKPEPGKAWRIPPEWGDCSIYVIGEPGSTFQLLEYAPTTS